MVGISVILLSHNRPYYVKQAINSVLWQTFTNYELMIVDNSTDDGTTRRVVESYGQYPSIKIFYEDVSQEDRHKQCIVSYLNNKYIDIAQGKYVFFFCDDDILLPNCLEEHWNFSESHDGCHCHSGQLWLQYNDGIWTCGNEHSFHNVIFNDKISPSCKLTGGAILVRTDYIKELGQPYFRQTNPQHCATADAVFFEDLANKHPILPVNQTLSIARFHSDHRSFEYWRKQK